jgi:hypothetical protein
MAGAATVSHKSIRLQDWCVVDLKLDFQWMVGGHSSAVVYLLP